MEEQKSAILGFPWLWLAFLGFLRVRTLAFLGFRARCTLAFLGFGLAFLGFSGRRAGHSVRRRRTSGGGANAARNETDEHFQTAGPAANESGLNQPRYEGLVVRTL
jgi:hypothetical protein